MIGFIIIIIIGGVMPEGSCRGGLVDFFSISNIDLQYLYNFS